MIPEGKTDQTIVVERTCPVCETRRLIEVDRDAWTKRQNGMLIQDAFPDFSADDREILISGTCPECWDIVWADEEDEA